MTKKATAIKLAPAAELKLDLGCGPNPRKDDGYTGVDIRSFPGVDTVADLRKKWPWRDESVTEVRASHFLEHLLPMERVHFANELYRVLKKGGKALITTPHWAAARAYGDMTHVWPPVSEFWFYYLNAKWRAEQAPANDFYTCDFEASWGYGIRPDLNLRGEEYRNYALANFKEAAQDMICTLTKK